MKRFAIVFAALMLFFPLAATPCPAAKIKIGFIVKQPEEHWFQEEWKYAETAGREHGFEVVKIGGTDGERVLNGIDNLAAQGAKGFVICPPDVRLGPAVAARSMVLGLKVMSVDDRFTGPDGKPMEDIPHTGISALDIGRLAGRVIVEEVQARGWDFARVGFLKMTFDQLPTIKERTDGATEALLAAGLPETNVFVSPMRTLDVEGSMNAAAITIAKNSGIGQWVVAGGNDNSVLGAVRALEGQRFGLDRAIAVGINGTEAVSEFQKAGQTAFIASILLDARIHGYDTAKKMFLWITQGKEPDKVTWTSGTVMTRDNYKELMGIP